MQDWRDCLRSWRIFLSFKPANIYVRIHLHGTEHVCHIGIMGPCSGVCKTSSSPTTIMDFCGMVLPRLFTLWHSGLPLSLFSPSSVGSLSGGLTFLNHTIFLLIPKSPSTQPLWITLSLLTKTLYCCSITWLKYFVFFFVFGFETRGLGFFWLFFWNTTSPSFGMAFLRFCMLFYVFFYCQIEIN